MGVGRGLCRMHGDQGDAEDKGDEEPVLLHAAKVCQGLGFGKRLFESSIEASKLD